MDMEEVIIHTKHMRKETLKTLHKIENISKSLAKSTFLFS